MLLQEKAAHHIHRFLQPMLKRMRACRVIESFIRGLVLGPFIEFHASTKIASNFLRYKVRKDFIMIRTAVVCIQSAFRGFNTRTSHHNKLSVMSKFVILQSLFRGYKVRRVYKMITLARSSHVDVLDENEIVLVTSLVYLGLPRFKELKNVKRVQLILTCKRRLLFVDPVVNSVLKISFPVLAQLEENRAIRVSDSLDFSFCFHDLLNHRNQLWVDSINRAQPLTVSDTFKIPLYRLHESFHSMVFKNTFVNRRLQFSSRGSWMVLNGSGLFLSSTKNTLSLKQYIPLQSIFQIIHTNPNAIVIHFQQNHNIQVSFPNVNERKEWTQLIRNAITKQYTHQPIPIQHVKKWRKSEYSIPLITISPVSKQTSATKHNYKASLSWTLRSTEYYEQHRLISVLSNEALTKRRKKLLSFRAKPLKRIVTTKSKQVPVLVEEEDDDDEETERSSDDDVVSAVDVKRENEVEIVSGCCICLR